MDNTEKIFYCVIGSVTIVLIAILFVACTCHENNDFSNKDKIQMEKQIQQAEEYKKLNEATPEQPIEPEEKQIIQNYYITGNENDITINNYKKDENK